MMDSKSTTHTGTTSTTFQEAASFQEDPPATETVVVTDTMIDNIITLARQVGERLRAAGITCATAESCTGGLIGHLITETPGSSDYFTGGAITYSYAAKEGVLGVDHETLMQEGAVSYAVAQQMAQGARRLYDVDVAVAVTGVAGPGGGSAEKPVGTVHIHLSGANGYEDGRRFVWQSDRSGNKYLSAGAALRMIQSYLERRSSG